MRRERQRKVLIFVLVSRGQKRSSPYNELKIFRKIPLTSLVWGVRSGVDEESTPPGVLSRVDR